MDPWQEVESLCTIELHHLRNGRTMRARIAKPVSELTQPPAAPEPVRSWGARVAVEMDGALHVRRLCSGSWIGAVTFAFEYIRRLIPPGEERDWVDEEGLESWCIFPKAVPFAWGYELYREISRMVDDAERIFVDDVQRRRLAAEQRERENGK